MIVSENENREDFTRSVMLSMTGKDEKTSEAQTFVR